MLKEDRQFFDGLLTGAVIVGLVLITIITVILFRNGPEVGENLLEPIDLVDEKKDAFIEPITKTEPTDVAYYLETIIINGQQYVIIQILEHPTEDLMFRLLALDSPTLIDRISKYQSSEFSQAFNGDTIYYTNDNKFQRFEKVVFSFWRGGGQELINIDDNNQDMPQAPVGYVHVTQWLGDNLVIESIEGDAGTGHNEIFKYNPSDQTIESVIKYQTGWYATNDADIEIIYSTWSQGGRTIGQLVDAINGIYSNLYYLPSENIDWVNHNKYLIAHQTASEVGADIKSDNNLIRYSEGLEITVEGENLFIPWTAK